MGQERCPTNYNADSLRRTLPGENRFIGHLVAFRAAVVAVSKIEGKESPYLKTSLGLSSDTLFVAPMIPVQDLRVGKQYRFLGWLSAVAPKDQKTRRLNQQGFHVIAFAVVDEQTQSIYFPEKQAGIQVRQWISGRIPDEQ